MARILVIDDDRANLFYLRKILESKGHEVKHAESGLSVNDLISEFQPTIILLDLVMPDVDGFEVLNRIRNKEENKKISVIMLTANSEVVDLVKGLEAGADDYITKPFNPDELFARINVQLRIKELETRLLRNEQLETVLKMGRTIGHEINNPLTAILGNSELLLEKCADNKELLPLLKTISTQSQRIRDLVKKMMAITELQESEYIEGKNMIDLAKSN